MIESLFDDTVRDGADRWGLPSLGTPILQSREGCERLPHFGGYQLFADAPSERRPDETDSAVDLVPAKPIVDELNLTKFE
jgi:hypothetical protein